MRLLVLSQYFWPASFRINEEAQSLRQEGCEVTALTGQTNYPDGHVFEGYRGWRLEREPHPVGALLCLPLLPRGRSGALRLALNYLSFMVSAGVLGPWLLRGQRFDALLVYAPSPILQAIPAIWLPWLKSAPLVT